MPYALVNRIRMHYELAGHGDPVLLISGLAAPGANWTLQVKALAPHFQVITFDHRGVGETDLPAEPIYTTAQMADDAAALLSGLKLVRAHVIGLSMGGTVAQELALRHPRLVRSLVLASTWTEADARFLSTIEAWMALAYCLPIEERYRHVLYPLVFSPAFLEHKANVDMAFQNALAYPHQAKPEAVERQGRGVLAWNGTRVGRLGAIKVPTLVLVGKDDILTPRSFARALVKRIGRARLTVLPGAHALHVEQPEAFNRAVLRFLKSVRSK